MATVVAVVLLNDVIEPYSFVNACVYATQKTGTKVYMVIIDLV